MELLDKNTSVQSLRSNNFGRLLVCQLLGLVALALIVYTTISGRYHLLIYALAFMPMLSIIPKSDFIPYVFVASLLTIIHIYTNGWMLSIQVVDVTFLLLFAAFALSRKIDIGAALLKQRALLTVLCLFALWATIGFVINFYGHEPLENASSAFYIYKAINLVAAVIIFSLPDWKAHRDKIIMFYFVCLIPQLCVAFAQIVMYPEQKTHGILLGGHHGMLGLIMILSIGVSSAFFFQSRNKIKKIFAAGICFLCVVELFLSGSRSNIMGALISIMLTLVLSYSHKRNVRYALLFFVPIMIVMFFMLREVLFNLSVLVDINNPDVSAFGRVMIWERVYEHALYGPWWQKIVGIGIGTFNTLTFNYYLEVGTFTNGAHNNFLHAFVETGIVGLIIFLSIFGVIIRDMLIKCKQNDNAARCFLFSTLAMLFSGLTQEAFWFNVSFGRIWLTYIFLYLMLFNFNNDFSKGEPNGIIAHTDTGGHKKF